MQHPSPTRKLFVYGFGTTFATNKSFCPQHFTQKARWEIARNQHRDKLLKTTPSPQTPDRPCVHFASILSHAAPKASQCRDAVRARQQLGAHLKFSKNNTCDLSRFMYNMIQLPRDTHSAATSYRTHTYIYLYTYCRILFLIWTTAQAGATQTALLIESYTDVCLSVALVSRPVATDTPIKRKHRFVAVSSPAQPKGVPGTA